MAERTVSVRLTALVTDYQRAMNQAEGSTKSLANEVDRSTKRNNQNLQTLGTVGLAAGGALAFGLTKVVGSAMGFEKEMSGVKAVSGATAGRMKLLGDAAIKAGADTIFSASEAAQAEAELVKAGISTSDVLSGALTGSLNLAAAGQLDLANAAEISAQAMNIFNLEGSDVAHIADVLAAGANKSAADVGQLGDALRQGGLVAAQTRLSLEETVGVLSAFADSALVGSDAGTSLKSMLQRLTPQSAEAASLMEQLGISAYDAQGNFIGLEGLAGELQTSLSGLTAEQRNTALATIFGSDAVRGANVLYEQGAAGIAEYVAAVNDQGAATRMAAELTNNLAGDFEQLGGSLETVFIQAGGGASGVLRGLVQYSTDLVNRIGELPPALATAGVGLGAIASGGLLAMGAVGTLVPRVREAREALVGMGSAGETANNALGKLGRAAGGAAILVAIAEGANIADSALDDLSNRIRGRVVPDINELAAGVAEAGSAADLSKIFTDELGYSFDQLVSRTKDTSSRGWFEDFVKGSNSSDKAIKALDESFTQLVTMGPEGLTLAKEQMDLLGLSAEQLAFSYPQATAAISDAEAAARASAAATGEAEGAADGLTGAMGELNEATGESIVMSEAEKEAREAQLDVYKALGDALGGFVGPMDAYNAVLERSTEASRTHAEGIAESTTDAGDSWEDYVGEAVVSLGEFAAELQKQIDAQDNWANNLRIIAGRGREDVARELAAMGPEGAGLVAEFATATEAEMNHAGDLLVESTRRGTAEAGQALDTELKVMGEIARQGANATVQSVAEALGVLPGEVARLAEEANIALRNAEPGWNESWERRRTLTLTEMQALKDNAPPLVRQAADDINTYLAERHPAFAEQMASRRGVSVAEMNAILRDAPPPLRAAAELLNQHLRDTEPGWGESLARRGGYAVARMNQMRAEVPPIVADTAGGMTGALLDRFGSFSGAVGQYHNRLASGIQTVRVAVNGPGGLSGIGRQADGGIVEFYAQGGLKEKHNAQIARAGDWRVWAEPETGGEAYIPLASSKRDRSTAILREVAERFGMSLRDLKDLPQGVDYHEGGLYVPPGAPSLPSYGVPIRPAGEQTMENARAFTADWAKRHMQEEHHRMPQVSGGKALARVQSVMPEFPSLRITSTYRSPARNAAAGGAKNSYHMDRNNPAVDIGGPTRELDKLHAVLRKAGGWRELLWRVRGHYDHAHAAKEGGIFNGSRSFDRGGMLEPGWTQAFNGTGAPEAVVSADALTPPKAQYSSADDPTAWGGDLYVLTERVSQDVVGSVLQLERSVNIGFARLVDDLNAGVNRLSGDIGSLKGAWGGGGGGLGGGGESPSGGGAPPADDLQRYLDFTAQSGDERNDWLTHLPEEVQDPLWKYFDFLERTGDWQNDWLTHLPAEMRDRVRAAGQSMMQQKLQKYLDFTVQSGDWLNDWLTDLPESMKGPLRSYFSFVKNTDDWRNDWLTHLPSLYHDQVRSAGQIFAEKYDVGGWLQPGLTLAYNGTGVPERVLPAGGQSTLDFSGLEDRIAAAVSRAVSSIGREIRISQTFNQPISAKRVAQEISRELV